MKIYHYNKFTYEFERISNARANPKEKGEFLIPAYATIDKPPKHKKDFAIIFKKHEWIYEEKHVGTFYDKQTLKSITEIILGPLPDNLTILKPKTPFDKWEIDKWVTVRHIYYYKLQKKIWILDNSKEQELKQVVEDVYDCNIKKIIRISIEEMELNIIKETTHVVFENLKFNFIKTQSIENKSKKDKLNSKTMAELMDIYNSIT